MHEVCVPLYHLLGTFIKKYYRDRTETHTNRLRITTTTLNQTVTLIHRLYLVGFVSRGNMLTLHSTYEIYKTDGKTT